MSKKVVTVNELEEALLKLNRSLENIEKALQKESFKCSDILKSLADREKIPEMKVEDATEVIISVKRNIISCSQGVRVAKAVSGIIQQCFEKIKSEPEVCAALDMSGVMYYEIKNKD